MAFKAEMQHLFKMSDLGLLSYYLGIEVKQERGKITLSERICREGARARRDGWLQPMPHSDGGAAQAEQGG